MFWRYPSKLLSDDYKLEVYKIEITGFSAKMTSDPFGMVKAE